MSLARWVWGEDRAVTPEYCIEFFPIMNNSCWSRLIVKGLGIAIILGACLNKAPVVINILNTKSTEGLSRISIYGEILSTYEKNKKEKTTYIHPCILNRFYFLN